MRAVEELAWSLVPRRVPIGQKCLVVGEKMTSTIAAEIRHHDLQRPMHRYAP